MNTTRNTILTLLCAALTAGAAWAAPRPAPAEDVLRVLHWNIEHGALHTKDGKAAGESMAAVEDVIRQVNPDVVCLTEVRNEAELRALGDALGMKAVFGTAVEGRQGNGLMSRLPLGDTKVHKLPFKEWQYRVAVEGTVEAHGSRVTVFATHLTFNNRSDKQDQVVELLNLMRRTPGPKILCGDFNDMDDRPNGYSAAGFINLLTGGHHGTILGPEPKLFDFHRKCAVETECRNDPPFFSPKTNWDEPGREANTISHWEPRVRIDHIFVSPEFVLSAPGNRCEVLGSGDFDWRGKGEKGAAFVSDHKPVLAEIALPSEPTTLYMDSLGTTTAVEHERTMAIAVGATDARGRVASLLRCDPDSPENDPRATARMTGRVKWSVDGGIGRVEERPVASYYSAMEKFDRPASVRATFHADKPGTGTITASVGGVSTSMTVVVLSPGEVFTVAKEEGK